MSANVTVRRLKRLFAFLLIGLLLLCFRGAGFAYATTRDVSAALPVSTSIVSRTDSSPAAQGGAQVVSFQRDSGRLTDSVPVLVEKPRWALFNLVISIVDALIALILLIRLMFAIFRDNASECEPQQEGFGEAEGKLGVEGVAGASEGPLRGKAGRSANLEPPVTLSTRLFTDICAVLAIASLLVFFVFEGLGGPMVFFDFLSPLFGALFVLTILSTILALVKSGREVPSRRGR